MTKEQFIAFDSFRKDFKNYCQNLNKNYSSLLAPLQTEAAKKDTPPYPLQTCVVYNTALDEVSENSDIHLIVIGDNPGKDEQLLKNNKYLVGQSGKIATGFFAKNPELKTDFRKNVIILNKTPVHTAKTNHLKFLLKNGGTEIQKLLEDSQIYMAKKTAALHKELCKHAGDSGWQPELWLVGYAELKQKGIFSKYRELLKESYLEQNEYSSVWEKVFVFQHFSMNRFSIDLKAFMQNHRELNLEEAIHEVGKMHKNEILV